MDVLSCISNLTLGRIPYESFWRPFFGVLQVLTKGMKYIGYAWQFFRLLYRLHSIVHRTWLAIFSFISCSLQLTTFENAPIRSVYTVQSLSAEIWSRSLYLCDQKTLYTRREGVKLSRRGRVFPFLQRYYNVALRIYVEIFVHLSAVVSEWRAKKRIFLFFVKNRVILTLSNTIGDLALSIVNCAQVCEMWSS